MEKEKTAKKLEIAPQTLDKYLNILEIAYLIDVVPSWFKSDYKYTQKQSKMFVCDTGLMCSMLKFSTPEDLTLDERLSGKIIETFIYNQLIAQIELDEEQETSLYHYREWGGKHEIDFVIENNNEIIGIEVKAGSNITKDDLRHLKWFKENIVKDKNFVGILLYTGEHAMSWGDDIYTIPINNLWD
jgi:predicted AAA+ superfamily ATPase